MNYLKAKENIVSSYEHELSKASRLVRRLRDESPEFKEADIKVRKLVMSLAEDSEIDKAKKEREKVLLSLGFSLSDLFPSPKCKKCGDTGLLNGRYCDCVKKLAFDSTPEFFIPPFGFSDSDFSLFDEERQLMERAYSVMEIFAEKFPETKKTNILLCGAVGTGKTSLAAAIANEVNKKGCSVAFLTAFKFNDICLRYHTTFSSDKFDLFTPLTDSDLLVIDDLGTEPFYKNVTAEYLYNIINERTVQKKHTVITTNLTREAIGNRYDERTASRLFDEKTSLVLALSGKDLRK